MEWQAQSPEEMERLGRQVATELRAGGVVALVGGLGAGKTHWTKGVVAGLGCPAEVTSPTFGLVHEYRGGRLVVHHLDFYRLECADELIALGWDEILEGGGVVVAEWADKFPEVMPADTRWLEFSIGENQVRMVRER